MILEAAFQLAAALCAADDPGAPDRRNEGADVWFVKGWRDLRLRRSLPDQLRCQASVSGNGGSPGSDEASALTADLAFFGPDDEPVGAVSGLAFGRTTRQQLVSGSANVRDLLYEVSWRPSPEGGALRSAGVCLTSAGTDPETRIASPRVVDDDRDQEAARSLTEDLERLGLSFILSAFRRLGWDERTTGVFAEEELRQGLGVIEQHRRLFGPLARLPPAGRRNRCPRRRTLGADPEPERSFRLHSRGTGGVRGTVAIAPTPRGGRNRFPEPGGGVLAEVLRGRADGRNVLFAGTPGALDVVRESGFYRSLRLVLAKAVAAAVRKLPEDRRLRVLEVGASTGAFTEVVLPELPAGRTDYAFTDGAPEFFGKPGSGSAKREFGWSTACSMSSATRKHRAFPSIVTIW